MSTHPLYLHAGQASRLDVDHAQRLLIERELQPQRHIPLHLVSRIVCSSRIDISAAALTACLRHGISIALVEPNGQTLGWCMGARNVESSLRQLLEHALDDPQWDALYPPWLALQTQAIAAQNLLICGVPTSAAARRNPRAALCNVHRQHHQQACGRHVDALARLACHELVGPEIFISILREPASTKGQPVGQG